MTWDYASSEWLRVTKLCLSLFQLPEQQLEAVFEELPKPESTKLLVRAALQLQPSEALEMLEKIFTLCDPEDIVSALQMAPRNELEKLVLQRLEEVGNLGEGAKFLVDSLSEKELQVLAFLAFQPRDYLIMAPFFTTLLSPDRRNEIINEVRQKKGLA